MTVRCLLILSLPHKDPKNLAIGIIAQKTGRGNKILCSENPFILYDFTVDNNETLYVFCYGYLINPKT